MQAARAETPSSSSVVSESDLDFSTYSCPSSPCASDVHSLDSYDDSHGHGGESSTRAATPVEQPSPDSTAVWNAASWSVSVSTHAHGRRGKAVAPKSSSLPTPSVLLSKDRVVRRSVLAALLGLLIAVVAVALLVTQFAYLPERWSSTATTTSMRFHRSKTASSQQHRVIPMDQRKRVLLVTEGKSGSTILAEYFNQNPDVWYLFEPLYHPHFHLRQRHSITDGLRTILESCQYDHRLLRRVFWGYAGTKNRWFRQTFRTHPSKVRFTGGWERLRIRRQCEASPIVAVKLIRLPDFTPILPLLRLPTGSPLASSNATTPSDQQLLFVVHLVRDPRAILASRLKKGWITSIPMATEETTPTPSHNLFIFRQHARLLCQRMYQKWRTSKLVPSQRYHRIHYEEWALDPERVAQQMHAFLGMKWSARVHRRVATLMARDQHRRGKKMDVDRRRETLDAWKQVLSKEMVRVATEECQPVLALYGYSTSF